MSKAGKLPDFIFSRQRAVGEASGFTLAGKLLTDIPKHRELSESDRELIFELIQTEGRRRSVTGTRSAFGATANRRMRSRGRFPTPRCSQGRSAFTSWACGSTPKRRMASARSTTSSWRKSWDATEIATVLGVDIGNRGAIALIDARGELLEVHDMPTLDDGPKGRPASTRRSWRRLVASAGASLAYVEWVGPRPTDGAVQAFAFGRCKGVVEGVLAASGVPVAFLTPPQWKRLAGIAPGKAGAKDAARSEACRRWPAKAGLFQRKGSGWPGRGLPDRCRRPHAGSAMSDVLAIDEIRVGARHLGATLAI